jgi:polar amino acid transport system substrate-binding protein
VRHSLRYATLAEALSALARQDIDALVHDEAVLRYAVRHDAQGAIQVLPEVVEREYYAFALPSGSPLREPLNVALLKVTARPAWQDLQHRYLGSP